VRAQGRTLSSRHEVRRPDASNDHKQLHSTKKHDNVNYQTKSDKEAVSVASEFLLALNDRHNNLHHQGQGSGHLLLD